LVSVHGFRGLEPIPIRHYEPVSNDDIPSQSRDQIIDATDKNWSSIGVEPFRSPFQRHRGWNLVLNVAFRCFGLKLKEWGVLAAGLAYVTVSGAIRRFKGTPQKNKELAYILSRAKSQLEDGKV
jgi:hypothetical protein